jgi:hypothetical protein
MARRTSVRLGFARVAALLRSHEANIRSPARSTEVDETEVNRG